MDICFWVLIASNIMLFVIAVNGTRLAQKAQKSAKESQKSNVEVFAVCIDLFERLQKVRLENYELKRELEELKQSSNG